MARRKPSVVAMTDREILSAIDEVTRKRLGRPGVEVLTAYRAGVLDDPGVVGDVLVLADLLSPQAIPTRA